MNIYLGREECRNLNDAYDVNNIIRKISKQSGHEILPNKIDRDEIQYDNITISRLPTSITIYTPISKKLENNKNEELIYWSIFSNSQSDPLIEFPGNIDLYKLAEKALFFINK